MKLEAAPLPQLPSASFKKSLVFLTAIILLSGSAFASGRKFNELSQREESVDRPGERDAYFMAGRKAPAGKKASELRRQAHQLKMQERAKRAQLAKTSSIRPAANATIPVGNSATVWRAVGPTPIRPQNSPTDNSGPVTGRVTAIAVDQTDATGNTVLVGGAYGGVWKSTNAAAGDPSAVVWTPLTDDQATLSVGSIAISPANHNIILVGTGEAKSAIDSYYGLGFLRSTDGGQTWSLISSGTANGTTVSLAGLGFGHITFSSDGATVVASSTPTPVGIQTGAFTANTVRGLWTSTSSGQTWTSATVSRGGFLLQSSATSVIYNPTQHKFYASLRYQGVFQSSDGITWAPTTGQPSAFDGTSCPIDPSSNNYACRFYRGELAMRAGRDEMYLWVADDSSNDRGIYKSTDGGATWVALDQTGVDQCGDSSACGGYQTFFNMAIAAVPNPSDSTATDVYLGAGNWFKCTVNAAHPSCAAANPEPYKFMNITHVYGCSPEGSTSNVHPDQHAIDVPSTNSNIVYFGNDGGVYRTLTSTGLNTASCAPPGGRLPFDNLNTTLGSLAQFNHASADPSDPTGFIAGAQDNGTSMTNSSIAFPGNIWQAVLGGDGGHTAINPNTPTTVYTALTEATIGVCTQGYSCSDASNNWSCVADNTGSCGGSTDTLSLDDSAFYAPFILDPQMPTKMLIGTCRVWRGNASSTYGGTAISPDLYQGTTGTCVPPSSGLDQNIYSLAAGGPKTSNGSQVIYAGLGTGQIFRTLSADTGVTSWANVTPTALNPNGYRISDLQVDFTDVTGKTAYATVMGFGSAHVIKTSDGGTTWTRFDGAGFPDSPADSLVIDPDDHTVIYVGTDVGVFATTNNGASWTEVGPTSGTGFLPNVVVSHVTINKTSTKKMIVASTYGRGVWVAELATSAAPAVSLSSSSLQFTQAVGATSAAQSITVTNSGTSALTVSSVSITGTNASVFGQTNNCTTVAAGSTCTVNVTFTPTAVGSFSASVSIADNASGSPHTVALTGTTPAPVASLSTATLQFTQAVGTTSAAQSITVTNSGSATLTVSSVAITGANASMFAQTNNCTTIAAGSTCTIDVTFTPTAAGNFSATVSITDDASGSPHSVALSGGTPPTVGVSPTSLSFGVVPIGFTSTAKTLTITNTGGSASSLTVGTLSAPYAVSSNSCGTSLAVGASCTVQVTFTPTAIATANASLAFTATPNSTVSISGSGEDFSSPAITTSTSVTVNAGASAAYTVSIAPGSTGNYSGAIALSCSSGLPNLASCSFNPTSVTPNSATVTSALSISTTARSSNRQATSGLASVLFSFTLVLPGLAMFAPKQRRTRMLILALIVVGIALVLAMGACGGGGGGGGTPPPPPVTGTTAGSYTVTVTATSGTNTKTTNVTIVVN